MEYNEEDFLQLSGIQHFCFCRRQWALIHIEQQWRENLLTVEGKIVHEHCHNENFLEKRGDLLITRGLRVFSRELGATGQCDVVEFHRAADGCTLQGKEGLWVPYPIEYKRGRSKMIDADRLQLCGQALCLEHMLSTSVLKGALYYAETHRREEIVFDEALTSAVKAMFKEMHEYFRRGYTPKVKLQKGCSACSLKEVCLPEICRNKSLDNYYAHFLDEVEA